tara:strand:- start:266 stop:556 length:291 start_codon:yes stop_codon:yes gene_type:complete
MSNKKFYEKNSNDLKFKEVLKEWQQINETLPAFPREWKNLEKACDDVYKAIAILGKAVGKVDKKHERQVVELGKYVSSHLKKFKELVSKEILSKLQ